MTKKSVNKNMSDQARRSWAEADPETRRERCLAMRRAHARKRKSKEKGPRLAPNTR